MCVSRFQQSSSAGWRVDMWQMVSQKVLHGHQRVMFRFEILL